MNFPNISDIKEDILVRVETQLIEAGIFETHRAHKEIMFQIPLFIDMAYRTGILDQCIEDKQKMLDTIVQKNT